MGGAAKKVKKFGKKAIGATLDVATLGQRQQIGEEIRRPFEDLQDSMTPDIPPLEDPAPVADLGGVQAAEAERRRRRGGGRASTILTSPGGVAGSASVGTKKLLGQ